MSHLHPGEIRYPLNQDDLASAPFDPRFAYRAYRVTDPEGPPQEIAGTPSLEGIGLMLDTLEADGEFGDDAIGVLDTTPRAEGLRARWLINPYAGRRR